MTKGWKTRKETQISNRMEWHKKVASSNCMMKEWGRKRATAKDRIKKLSVEWDHMEYGYVYVMSANEIFMLNAERIQLSVHISVHKIVLFFFSLPVVVALLFFPFCAKFGVHVFGLVARSVAYRFCTLWSILRSPALHAFSTSSSRIFTHANR